MAKGVKTGTRTRRLTRGQKKKVTKRKVGQRAKLPGSFRLTWRVLKIFRENWRTLGGIVLVYLVLNIVFASGISGLSSSVADIKANLQSGGSLGGAITGFSSLVGSAGTGGSQTASVLQGVLIILESLVIIWALRHLLAGKKIGIKQAYYQSMFPLIPFMLVVFVIFIQLLPLTIGWPIFSAILGVIFNPGAMLTGLSLIIFGLLAAWSFYMISSSIFAIYIVTLPDMQPRPALRSAKDLVKFRRWALMRKVFFLPVFILVVMGIIVVPLIAFASFLVAPVFYALSMLAILFIHTYLYSLYRSLLE
ncbi:MAG TPA: hypothetical protein VFW52_00565 [Candidatus Saccharimonadales bacterium]|nr:hypothetical protein [Candidatus Saccharimonadales bacterium]